MWSKLVVILLMISFVGLAWSTPVLREVVHVSQGLKIRRECYLILIIFAVFLIDTLLKFRPCQTLKSYGADLIFKEIRSETILRFLDIPHGFGICYPHPVGKFTLCCVETG